MKNDELPDFYELTLYMILMIILSKIAKIGSEIVKIGEFTLVMIVVIFPQKWHLRLATESFEIFRDSA